MFNKRKMIIKIYKQTGRKQEMGGIRMFNPNSLVGTLDMVDNFGRYGSLAYNLRKRNKTIYPTASVTKQIISISLKIFLFVCIQTTWPFPYEPLPNLTCRNNG